MSQDVSTLTKSPGNYTVIQVDQDISFVLDSNDVNYTVPSLSTNKNIGMPRKTYSKKHPVTYNPCVSFSDDSISVISSSATRGKKQSFMSSPKCTSNSVPNTGKGIRRKRTAELDRASECPVHKKSRKRNVSSIKALPTKINGRITNRSVTVSDDNRELSPDSDLEIVDIVEPGTSKSSFGRDLNDSRGSLSEISRKKNSPKSLNSILEPCYPANDDVPITEADTAPAMPSYSVISNSLSESSSSRDTPSSIKWLSASGTIDFPPIQNGGSCSAKESVLKYADKYNLYIPEMKISQNENVPQKRSKGKRELEKLFEDLNEISWANEKSFKQMLTTSTADGRHSERITAKVSETEKNMRRLKSGALRNLKLTSTRRKPNVVKKNSANLVLKRAKYGKLKPKVLVKTAQRHEVPFNKVNKIKSVVMSKKLGVKKPVTKPNKIKVVTRPGVKPSKVNVKSVSKPGKVNVAKSVGKPSKVNVAKSVIKPNVISYPNANMKPQKSILKKPKSILKPDKSLIKSSLKGKSVQSKNGPKVKIIPAFNENLLISPSSSTSDFQNIAGNCSYSVANNDLFSAFGKNTIRNDDIHTFKDSSFVKELKNFQVSNELEVLKSCIGEDEDFDDVIENGSKLKVRVEPIENTKLWSPDFFEAFKKHVLDQAFLKTFERRDQESINTMFQELQEACFNPQNNVKPLKRKKPEEETLRSSVRQSEGAFRYKEIVVKKHENYMQFVLVPNSCKRNSLTIEAMKELRDAFLLAKKDPNCRAVLLNSSGTYFCTGIDLSLLVGSNKKQVAEEMASTIRDLVLTLSTFTKPVIAAVNGTAVGFGVSLLTYCDVVLASDKATFCIPATRLGYLPEGAITLTLPQVVGSGVATEMLLYGRRLTAEQALRHGLVSEVLWPTQLMNEVVPRIQTIVSQPLQVMEATKTMVRCHLWDKLKTHIDREWRLLPPLWLEAQCQHNIKRTLQTGWLVD